ncbi:F-box/LRR-repeat protein 6 isoform X1 [Ranitomeya imitator]|uniref:F-box/LRR-repeat protein 6 isoform X1 n=2 Tax=Ranitomeya imitator TaxID=111125 RepID=UPI0037E76404
MGAATCDPEPSDRPTPLPGVMASHSSHGRHTGKPAKKTRSKRRHSQRLPADDCYVQHTVNDMLFFLPPDPEEIVTVVKRVRKAVCASPPITTDHGWGSMMPQEILHRVFQLVVDSEGAVPTLCRLAQVCRLWHLVTSSPDLWRQVSVSTCWKIPKKNNPPRLQMKIRKTIEELIKNRLSQVSDFSLHHWNDHIPFVLQSLASFCPLLTALTLSHCSKVTADALVSVGESCPHLTSLNLQDSEVDSKAVSRFLDVRGSSLRCLFLSVSCQTNNILSLLTSGSCPELRVLEVNRGVEMVQVWAENLQGSCPKLEVLRLLNYTFQLKSRSSQEGPGFCHLQELCLATSVCSHTTDADVKRLLRDCTSLRVLDLRGCNRVSPEAISDLPCMNLESLYLGMYSFSSSSVQHHTGFSTITRRWRHSLQELDLTGLSFCDSELRESLGILTENGTNDTLKSLVLSGTKVSAATVRDVLSGCRALTHLDLSSCRNVPRGLKHAYRGRESVLQCLDMLSSRMQEDSLE